VSGGSYNYLCWNASSLTEHRGSLESMTERLEGLPWGAQAAAASRRCISLLDEAERLANSLQDAWHAIEWWDSCDWSQDGAREHVERYVPPDGIPAEDVLYRLVDVGAGVFELRPVPRDDESTSTEGEPRV
jgi:hypothetical protein